MCAHHVNSISLIERTKDLGGKLFPIRLEESMLNVEAQYGECFELGSRSGFEVITNLLIDDGNFERSNREKLLSENFRFIGIAFTETHPTYGRISYSVLGNQSIEERVEEEDPAGAGDATQDVSRIEGDINLTQNSTTYLKR